MKKMAVICLCGLAAAALVTGCSKKSKDSVELGNYIGVEYTPASVEVTDADVDAQVQSLLASKPVETEVDRAAQKGDVVNIDYVGLKDGKAFEGGTAQGFDLTLGSGQFIDGFEDGLIGATKGQELSLNITFPEQYPNKDLAGQPVVFDVTVNTVKESKPAVLDDAFIKANTDSQTLEEYREATKKSLTEAKEKSAETQKQSDTFQKVLADSKVTVSDETIEAYYQKQMDSYEKQAKASGVDLETMAGYYGMKLDDFKSTLKGMASDLATQDAVVKAIAKKEKIEVSDDDLTALAKDFQYSDKEAMIAQVGKETADDYVLREKVMKLIADKAVAAS